jgi:UDPglucose 6-dehydrogenase
MRIAILGTGYVGLVSAACFARAGHDVFCVDIDDEKIAALRRGEVPIYEAGLADLIAEGRRRERLHFTSNTAAAVKRADAVFIAVGTPTRQSDGHADLSQVYAAVESLAPALKPGTLVATKSTVPVGTGDAIESIIRSLRPELKFEVASNPEFLRAGHAVQDFLRPDRVVIGVQRELAAAGLIKLYRSVGIEHRRILLTDRRSSELIKYAANGFLATKIAFINEIADLCEKVDARIGDVTAGIGLDQRIGMQFLQPGPGFGGSCFPKDARALAKMGEDYEAPMRVIETVLASNESRKRSMTRKVAAIHNGALRGKTITLLGLTFKAGTDDMRDAISVPLAHGLTDAGVTLRAYDPVAMDRARAHMPPRITYCDSALEAAAGADAVIVLTEWKEFTQLDLREMKARMRVPLIVDLRNVLDERTLRKHGFRYCGIGGVRRHAFDRQSSAPRLPQPSWIEAAAQMFDEDLQLAGIAAAE